VLAPGDHSIDDLYARNADQHAAIRAALAAGSGAGARALAREHVLSSFELLEAIVDGVGWRAAGRGLDALAYSRTARPA
jgi:DNA-binding GntR family transcriptional regulator